MLRRIALVAATSLAVAAGAAAPATAAPAPQTVHATVAARKAVTRATVHQIYVAVAKDRQLRDWKRSEWRVQRIRVSTSGTWARATVHPTNGRTDDAVVLLKKSKGVWRTVDLGTAQVGCGVAPASVLTQLRLGGC